MSTLATILLWTFGVLASTIVCASWLKKRRDQLTSTLKGHVERRLTAKTSGGPLDRDRDRDQKNKQ